MKNEKFNLVDDKWIPVIMSDGTNIDVSLMDIYDNTNIVEIDLKPINKISVLNLLVVITSAALGDDDLKDETSWYSCYDKISSRSKEYLNKHHDQFYLYGEHPFMQIGNLQSPKANLTEIEKIFIDKVSGTNGKALFDKSLLLKKKYTDAETAIALLTFLCYHWSEKSSVAVVNNTQTSTYTKDCTESKHITTRILGCNIIKTIWYNLPTIDIVKKYMDSTCSGLGKPMWEYDSNNLTASRSNDGKKSVTSIKTHNKNEYTFNGRTVPLSRMIKICDNGVILGSGIEYECYSKVEDKIHEFRDIYTPFTERHDTKKSDIKFLSPIGVSSEKQPWRDLHSILSTTSNKKSPILEHLDTLVYNEDNDNVVIMCCGLEMIGNQKNVPNNQIEWRLKLSTENISDENVIMYSNCVDKAESTCSFLIGRIKKEYKETYGNMADLKRDGKLIGMISNIKTSYWNELNKYSNVLFNKVCENTSTSYDWWSEIICNTVNLMVELYVKKYDESNGKMYNKIKFGIKPMKNIK